MIVSDNNVGWLEKAGSGTLTLSGTNTFGQETHVNGGILSITSTGALQGTRGLTIAGGAGLTYTGGAATFSKPVTVTAGSGTGTIQNSGGGLLTLSGTLSKDNSVLRLTGGAFNVTGLITGSTPGGSDLVVDAAAVTLSNTNTYDGPTFVYNSGTLTLGVSNAIPSNSLVTLGGPGTGTLDLGANTNTIAGLAFAGSGGTLKLAANQTAGVQLVTNSSLSLGADTSLDLTGMATSAGLYRLINGTSLSGTFVTVTGLDSRYVLRYGTVNANEVDAQRKADQGTTFTMTTGTASRVLVNTTVAVSGSLTNSTPANGTNLAVSLSSGGADLTVTGFSSGTNSVAPLASTSVVGTIQTGTSAGTRTWSVINTDNNAITTTSTASGSIDVVNQRSFSVSNSGTINLGNFLRTAAVSGSATISSSGLNATTANASLGAFFDTNTNGLSLATNDLTTFNGAAYQEAIYTLSGSAASAGSITGSFTANVAAELGSIDPVSVALVGTAYDPATAVLASGGSESGNAWTINFGEFNQGSGTTTPWNFAISNQSVGIYTADLVLDSFSTTQDSGEIFMDLSGTSFPTLLAGGTNGYTAWMSLANPGLFTNVYQLNFKSAKDGQVLGGTQSVTLTVTGIIVVPEPGTLALAGIGIAAVVWAACRRN